MDIHVVLDMGLLLLLLVAAFAVLYSRNLLVATMMLSIFSLLMALMYLTMGAPDVAITEAAIGGGISTILMLAALLLTGEEEKKLRFSPLPLLTVTVIGAMLIYATVDMPRFGSPNTVTNDYLTPYYLSNAMPETNVPNVVTAVLASYRGFDTLGEVYVVFTAGMSVLLLLGGKKRRKVVKE